MLWQSFMKIHGKRRKNSMFCSECGTELNPDAKFCTKCGKQVAINKNANSSQNKEAVFKNKRSMQDLDIRKDSIILISLVLMGIVAFMIFGSWIEINGYEMSFFDIINGINKIDDVISNFGTSTDEVNGILAFSWFIFILQLCYVGVFFYIIFSLFNGKKTANSLETLTTLAIVFFIMWLAISYFTYSLELVGEKLAFIECERTGRIWYTLVIFCLACAIHGLSYKIDKFIFGIKG